MRTNSIKKFAIVGKIGSGKSYVSSIMADKYNIPIFNTNDDVKTLLKHHFGDDIYKDGRIDAGKFAKILFKDRKCLDISNAIIAPRVMCNFYQWMDVLHAPPEREIEHVVSECANLLDTDFYKLFDHIILIDTSYQLRKARVLLDRDMTRDEFDIRDKMQLSIVEMERKIAGKIPYTIFDNDGHDDAIDYMINSTIFNEYGT